MKAHSTSEHMGALPQQENSNLQLIGQYQALLQANAEAITRAQQNKQYLQSLLEVNNSKPADKMGSLESARTELAAAEQRYTPSHPDVIRLRSLVKSLEQQQANSTKENSIFCRGAIQSGAPATSTSTMFMLTISC